MYVIWVLAAVAFFTAGGVSMKFFAGMTRWIPTVLFRVFFVIGVAFQALALRDAELGIAYAAVLGLEGVLVAALGVLIFSEPVGHRSVSEY
jgi:multidrug transporter EmrE-like cation transporter